jgi:hypothetical protein
VGVVTEAFSWYTAVPEVFECTATALVWRLQPPVSVWATPRMMACHAKHVQQLLLLLLLLLQHQLTA